MSTTETSSSTIARTVRVVCLIASFARGSSGFSAIQQTVASSSRATVGACSGSASMSPRETSTSSASRTVTDMPGMATSSGPSAVSTEATEERRPEGSTIDVVARLPDAAGDLARVAAVVVVLVGDRADHPLDGEAAVVEVAVAGDLDRLEVLEQRRPVVPGHRFTLGAALDDVVAAKRRHRDHLDIAETEPLARVAQLLLDLAEALLRELGEIHLVHGDDDVRRAEDRGDVRVAAVSARSHPCARRRG